MKSLLKIESLEILLRAEKKLLVIPVNRRDSVVVRVSILQSVDMGFILLVESYQKTLRNGIHSFFAWHLTFRGGCGEQDGKFAGCVLGQGT